MHFGATLRLLRTDAGLTLRELAERVGVSSAYLSRVENGHDAPPSPDRLATIARAFNLPAATLIALADRLGPFASSYLSRVPEARELVLEMQRRRLGPVDVARIRAFIEREFPAAETGPTAHWVDTMCAPERVVLRLSCDDMDDVLDIASTRLAPALGVSASALSDALKKHEDECSTELGHGFAIPHALLRCDAPRAVVVTLRTPIEGRAANAEPLRMFIVHVHGGGREHTRLIATLARFAETKFVTDMCAQRDPERLLARLRIATSAL